MKLVIGGYAQGKLHYVLQKYHLPESAVSDGKLPQKEQDGPFVLNHFHDWFRDSLEWGECPEEIIREYLKRHPNCIIISNEVGNGIVPMGAFERDYRERLGRCLIEIADTAEEVERVICGLGQRIK